MRLYTFLAEEQIVELTSVDGEALRAAKRVLAFESTALTHGEDAAREAEAAANVLFARAGGTGWSDDPSLPTTEIPAADISDTTTIADLFIKAGLCASRGEARRLAQQGGLSINDERVDSVDAPRRTSTDPSCSGSAKSASAASWSWSRWDRTPRTSPRTHRRGGTCALLRGATAPRCSDASEPPFHLPS